LQKLLIVIATLASLVLLLVLFVISGAYNVGADRPHIAVVQALLEAVRERSIVRRVQTIAVPPLDGAQRLREGAEHYSAMCVDCHLAPGITVSEIRIGLSPPPPNLSQHEVDPRVAFWTIKHGIKMTGMPAWGKTHDDQEIWNIVAFVERLPHMSASEYRAVVASIETEEHESARDEHEHHHEHEHAIEAQRKPGQQ
jgi:mono/diheme cytochrome c family protein